MKIHPTVLLVADDDRLCRQSASHLRDAGFEVRTGSDSAAADVVVRDWRTEPWPPPQSIPLVTVDLGVVQGQELSEMVVRVLGFESPEPDDDLDPRAIRH